MPVVALGLAGEPVSGIKEAEVPEKEMKQPSGPRTGINRGGGEIERGGGGDGE